VRPWYIAFTSSLGRTGSGCRPPLEARGGTSRARGSCGDSARPRFPGRSRATLGGTRSASRLNDRWRRARHGRFKQTAIIMSHSRCYGRRVTRRCRKPGQVHLMRQTGRCGMRAIRATGGWGRSGAIPARSSPERTRQFAHERVGIDASLGTDCRGVYLEGVGCAKLADDERPSPRDVMASAGTPCAAIRSPPLRRRRAIDGFATDCRYANECGEWLWSAVTRHRFLLP